MSKWVVLKFGGTSVANPDSWKTIGEVTRNYRAEGFKPLVVCSALAGISNALASLMPEKVLNNAYQPVIDEITQRHHDFATDLGVDPACVAEDLAELSRLCLGMSLTKEISPAVQARVMGLGELMLTRIGAAYLAKQQKTEWLDARELLQSLTDPAMTDVQNTLSANCDFVEDADLQKSLAALDAELLITQGFIARDEQGRTVLLGRGGSDTSAAYLAAKLQAARCEIWTDVPGIYTTNPHAVPAAKLLKALSFDEAREIAATGAKVLHPRCLDPLAHYNIPLSVHCTPHPDWQGTHISNDVPLVEAQVKAVSLKTGVTVISMETTMMWHQVGFLSNVFACFQRHHISVDLIATSENNVTVTLDSGVMVSVDALEAVLEDLRAYCEPTIIKPCASLSLVGRNIRAILHQMAPVFEVFKEQKIYLLTQATNDLNLTVVVDETQSETLLHKIHALLFEEPNDASVFGKSWQNAFPETIPADYWWYQQRDELIQLTEKASPLFVYSQKTLAEQVKKVKSITHVSRVFYAMKALWHPQVLQYFYEQGLGFECVSQGELQTIFAQFPEIDAERVLFTPNFAAREEYAYALDKGVFVNLDNLHPLEHWPELFADREILLRVDPGLGRGHHKYVQTGGSHSKFGIAEGELKRILPILEQHHIHVIGLHVHFGSGVLSANSWSENAVFLARIAEHFPGVRILDLGGGLGVPEKFGQAALDVTAVNDSLASLKQAYPRLEFWLEPGRFLVSEAGVLLARVTQLKHKSDVDYIGVDAGMNSLIRPSLYSAYHEIVNLSRIDAPRNQIAHIVGPICETGDTLGYSRVMSETQEGDVVLIANAGAYGRSMSSRYNLREPAKEVFLEG